MEIKITDDAGNESKVTEVEAFALVVRVANEMRYSSSLTLSEQVKMIATALQILGEKSTERMKEVPEIERILLGQLVRYAEVQGFYLEGMYTRIAEIDKMPEASPKLQIVPPVSKPEVEGAE